MKTFIRKVLLSAVITVASFIAAQAQTKGTNTLGLGVNFHTEKAEFNDQTTNETKYNNCSIGFGRFIEDNQRLGLNVFYSNYDYPGGTIHKTYGGSIDHQYYYPLFKKFYAFAGGTAVYSYSNHENNNSTDSYQTNYYSLGAFGGATYFISKRFAFEANLLSASVSYSKQKQSGLNGNTPYGNTSTSFNLSTTGAINNLGFKIYFLF